MDAARGSKDPRSTSFGTDFSNLGSANTSNLFEGAGSSSGQAILDEENRLIQKCFEIMDKDNSKDIDVDELKGMFHLFGVESVFLDTAIARILTNTGKSKGDKIRLEEFQALLSQKFSANDSEDEMKQIFQRMDDNSDGQLDVEELYKVAHMLGDDMDRTDIKEMIKMLCNDDKKRKNDLGGLQSCDEETSGR